MEFKYRDQVKIKSGFYSGLSGVLKAENEINHTFLVEVDNHHVWIKGENLDKTG